MKLMNETRPSYTFPLMLVAPALLLVAVINIYPFMSGLWYSVHGGSIVKIGEFVGVENYGRLLQREEFWNAFWFSLVFGFFGVTGSYLLGLGLALLLNQEFPGRGFLRAAMLLPWIIAPVVSVVSWRWLISDQSAFVNRLLESLGAEPVLFLAEPFWARVVVILLKIWRSYPFMFVSLLAVLQSIPKELVDSALIDGANSWQRFKFVTFPFIRMMSVIMMILMTIWCFNDFETIWLMTQGGPSRSTENLVVLAYKYFFIKNDIGAGAAIAVISLVIMMLLAFLMLRVNRKNEPVY